MKTIVYVVPKVTKQEQILERAVLKQENAHSAAKLKASL